MRSSKWHALGNVYLLVEQADGLTADRARELAHDTDGVLEIRGDEVTVWNPDGSTAEMSGNGARIAAAWYARRTGSPQVRFRIGERDVTATVDGDNVTLDAGRVEVGTPETLDDIELTPVSVGNPHAVVRRDPAEIRRLGPQLESHPRFPERTNVQLVRVDGEHDLTVAVWERGAGETTASGSSAIAAAAAAVANGWCTSPVTVHMPGGDLFVELAGGEARLTGPAVELA
ncbi:MAG: diaminopimelate epimerase [Gaiellaceae bacterium]|jgi:diaminopimelate epimerase